MERYDDKKYTYADSLEMGEGVRVEIIHGVLYKPSTPWTAHQVALRELFMSIANGWKDWRHSLYFLPLDVRLFEKDGDTPEDIDTVVEPDIMVVFDRNKIDERGIKGAPDWIIEILSNDTRRYDKITKRKLYEEAGVREYRIVEPGYHYVEVFIFNNGILEPVELYSETDIAKCSVLPQLTIDMSVIFTEV